MATTTWLVTGSSRGIGFEIVRQLLESPENLVVAACRTPDKATALQELKTGSPEKLHIIQIDVSDFDSIRAAAPELERILGETGLDYLVNNAGIVIVDTAFEIDPEVMLSMFRTNALGPALVSQMCFPLLKKGRTKKILNISSRSGSIGSLEVKTPVYYPPVPSYSVSKAALNMLSYKQKLDQPDLTVIALCPGWVRTDMGGSYGDMEPQESVSGILKVITSATNADSGNTITSASDATNTDSAKFFRPEFAQHCVV
ncbi:NAD-P-binding protein [Lenzites betulinus]|nr:NAD-P-binding protein [Lenzites betulinus]